MGLNTLLPGVLKSILFLLPWTVLMCLPTWSVYPSIVSKALFFRGMVQISFLLWLVLVLKKRYALPRTQLIFLGLLICLVIQLAADFSGIDWHRSVWSTLERMGGTMFQLHLLLYAVMITSVLTRDNLWKPFLICHVLAAISVCLYGYYDTFWKAGFSIKLDINDTSIMSSTLGSRSFTASYLLMAMFVAGLLFVRSKKIQEKYFFGGTFVLLFVSIWITLNRGAVLGAIGGCVIAALIILLTRGNSLKIRKYIIWGTVGSVCLIGAAWTVMAVWGGENIWMQRYALSSFWEDDARWMLWRIAWTGFLERPWLGYGNDNFNFVLNAFYLPELLDHEAWFDHPHNMIMERLVSAGLLGLAGFLALWGILFGVVFRLRKHLTPGEQWVIYGALAAYGIKSLFVFEAYADALIFYTLIGFLGSGLPGFQGEKPETSTVSTMNRVMSWKKLFVMMILAGSVLLAGFSLYYSVWREFRMNMLFADVLSSKHMSLEEKYRKASVCQEKWQIHPFFPPVLFSKFAIAVVTNPDVPVPLKNKYARLNIQWLKQSISKHPEQAKLHAVLGEFYVKAGLYQAAADSFDAALILSPRRAEFWYYLGAVKYRLKLYDQACSAFEKVLELTTPKGQKSEHLRKLLQEQYDTGCLKRTDSG
jgi:O-antigen ligase